MEIIQGVYGLPQAVIITDDLLAKLLGKHSY